MFNFVFAILCQPFSHLCYKVFALDIGSLVWMSSVRQEALLSLHVCRSLGSSLAADNAMIRTGSD